MSVQAGFGFKALLLYMIAVVVIALPAPAQTTSIYVDDSGDDTTGAGTALLPYATINKAVFEASFLSGTKIIKIQPGTYDWSHEAAFTSPSPPFPIRAIPDLRMEAANISSQVNWPRIGGGVPTSSTTALILVDAQSADQPGIELKNLYFVGETDASYDSPSAIRAINRGYTFELDIDTCYFERQRMDDGGSADRPTIALDLGAGLPVANIVNCEIRPSARAGVEAVISTDTDAENFCEAQIEIRDSSIVLEDGDDATYGIHYLATGETGSRYVHLTFRNNLIDSSACDPGSGIGTGIKVELTPDDEYVAGLVHQGLILTDNRIKACTGDGVWLRSDGIGSLGLIVDQFQRNDIRACIGEGCAGLRVDYGEVEGGPLKVFAKDNLISRNALGVLLHGVEPDSGDTRKHFINNTIAGNIGVAFFVADDQLPHVLINNIVYGNNSGGAQHGGSTSWNPTTSVPVEYCESNCWQGLYSPSSCDPDDDPNSAGNVTAAPGFVDEPNDDFHLTSSACARGKGDNTPDSADSLGAFDIDGEDRLNGRVDIGADEYHP